MNVDSTSFKLREMSGPLRPGKMGSVCLELSVLRVKWIKPSQTCNE